MNDRRRGLVGSTGVAALVIVLLAGMLIAIGRVGISAAARPEAPAAPDQAAPDPQSAPLPHYNPVDDATSHVWVIPLHFATRTSVTIGTPDLIEGKSHIFRTAPQELELELFDRSGAKIQSIYAWHPLRAEYAAVERPTEPPPRLDDSPAGPEQVDPRKYDPYHVIADSGDGSVYVPYDPRASSIRIVDRERGGVELGRASLEGAARRYCARLPQSAFCLGGGGGAGGAGGVGAVSQATLYFEPYTVTVGSNAVFTMELKARRMVDLYGGQVAVVFNPAMVQVVDQDPGRPGAQVKPGAFPVPDSVLRNAANNATGRLEYYFTLTGEKPGVSGAGTVAYVVMRAAGPGSSLLVITDTVLSDPQSLRIPTKTENAFVKVLDTPSASVSGQVELERRPTSAGAQVCSSGRCVTTGADGRFSLANVPVGRPVDVTHPSYLRSQRLLPASATGTVTWPKVKLLAGDLDKDDRVDIADAVMIGQRFNLRYNGTAPEPRWLEACDITDDDVVNILDMVGVQFNLLKVAPGAWPATLARPDAGNGGRLAQATTTVRLMPAQASADGFDQDVRLEIRVDDVARLYGYRVRLGFDPRQLQVRDVSPTDAGVQVEIGEFLDPINSFVLLNQADNQTGTVDVSITQTAPATGATGSGALATVVFRGRANGVSDVRVDEAVLVDDSEPVPATLTTARAGATVTIGGGAVGTSIHLPTVLRRAPAQ